MIGAIGLQILRERRAERCAADCPYPGCALEEYHEGDHVSRFRLVQRYRPFNGWTTHPGFCKVGECCEPAVALYVDHEGKTLEVCTTCEDNLVMQGLTELGKAGAA